MSVLRLALLGIAILAAIVAAVMARGLLNAQTAPAAPVMAKVETRVEEVLVAAKTIMTGQKLDAKAVHWVEWPEKSITSSMIKRSADGDSMAELANAIARSTIHEGEPIMAQRIVRPGQGGFMAAILPEGMQAISVRISAESGAGGFILPGDRVDVLLTRSEGKRASETVLSNVRVLAIDQAFRPGEKGEQVAVGKTATLELTPPQAKVLATSEALGNLSFTLRSLADSDEGAGPQLSTREEDNSSSVTVLRYGIGSHVNLNP